MLKLKNKNFTNKSPTSINTIDIKKTVVFNKVPFGKKGFKCFIGYRDAERIRTSCIFLPKMSPYRKHFDEAKYMLLS